MRKRSIDWREARRIKALELRRQGWKQCAIAEALDVTEGAVSQWINRARSGGGKRALRSKPRPGRPPSLDTAQVRRLRAILAMGATKYGFHGEVWTTKRICLVIRKEFSVQYNSNYVAQLLDRLGYSYQVPARLAQQRDDDAIERWRTQRWPELKKKAEEEGREIVFVDESGIYMLAAILRTWSLKGVTPELRERCDRFHFSVIAGVTPAGKLYTMKRPRSLNSWDVVQFLKHLLYHVGRDLLVIWDGGSIHKGEVKEYMKGAGQGRINIEPLPAYAPEINPTEGIWNNTKRAKLGNVCNPSRQETERELRLAIMRVRSQPNLIKSYFRRSGLY